MQRYHFYRGKIQIRPIKTGKIKEMHKSANVSKSNQGIGKGQFPGYLTTDQGVGGSNPLAHVKEHYKREYLSKDRYSFLFCC